MRLKNEPFEKVIRHENYSTFKNIINKPINQVALIIYTVFIPIFVVLTILDGGYIMVGVNLLVHGFVCFGLWKFRLDNLKDENLSTKGVKMALIANACKYVFVFIVLIVALILLIFQWTSAGAEAKQYLASLKNSLDLEKVAAAKHAVHVVFWKYFGTMIFTIVMTIAILVYYKAVMSPLQGTIGYKNKGTHFWKDLKFSAIYLFVVAGLLIVFSVLMMTGLMDKVLALYGFKAYDMIVGGTGIMSGIGRILFAGVLIFGGVLLLKGQKELNSKVTFTEEKIMVYPDKEPVTEE